MPLEDALVMEGLWVSGCGLCCLPTLGEYFAARCASKSDQGRTQFCPDRKGGSEDESAAGDSARAGGNWFPLCMVICWTTSRVDGDMETMIEKPWAPVFLHTKPDAINLDSFRSDRRHRFWRDCST